MSRDQARLKDIFQAGRRIRRFVLNEDFDSFLNDEKLQSAVIFQLLVIGEAAKHLSDDFRSSYDHIPRSRMARMRDRLIHGYFDVDLEIVWTTATRDVDQLVGQIGEIID